MKKKLIAFGIAFLIVGVCWLIDYLISLTYDFEIVSMEPYPGISDGATEMTITVRLTRKDGTPVEGHDVNILSLDGGTYKAYRQRTDEDGIVQFVFIPFLSTTIRPAQDVRMRVRDESNSIFIAVPAMHEFIVEVDEPEDGHESGAQTSESVFG